MECQRKLIKCEHLCKEKCHGESPCDEYKCDEKIFWYCIVNLIKKVKYVEILRKKKKNLKRNIKMKNIFYLVMMSVSKMKD